MTLSNVIGSVVKGANRLFPRYNVNVSERHSFEGCEGACREKVPLSTIRKEFKFTPDVLEKIRSLAPGDEIFCGCDEINEYYVSRAR